MVYVPSSRGIPAVGDEISVELRLTTATVDEVVLEDSLRPPKLSF